MALDPDYYLALTYYMHLVTFTCMPRFLLFFFFQQDVGCRVCDSSDKLHPKTSFGDAGTPNTPRVGLRPPPEQGLTLNFRHAANGCS